MTPAKKPAATSGAKKTAVAKNAAPALAKSSAKKAPTSIKKVAAPKAAPAKKATAAAKTPAKAPAKVTPTKATKAPAAKKTPAKAAAKATTKAPSKVAPAAPAPKAAPVTKPVVEKKPAPAKAAPAKVKVNPYLKEPKFLDEMRQELEDKKTEELARAADLRGDAESLTSNREPGDDTFNEESGEGSTFAVDRADLLFNAEKAMEKVDEIDEALYRMQRGTYGVCETCHEPIPKLRLRAMPEAKECVACKNGGLTRR